MTILAQHFILCQQQSLYGTHQRSALTGEVGCSLTLESGFKQIARTDADAKSYGAVEGTARSILIDGIRGVQPASFQKHGAQRCARPLGSHHDDINVCRRNHTRTVVPGDGSSMPNNVSPGTHPSATALS